MLRLFGLLLKAGRHLLNLTRSAVRCRVRSVISPRRPCFCSLFGCCSVGTLDACPVQSWLCIFYNKPVFTLDPLTVLCVPVFWSGAPCPALEQHAGLRVGLGFSFVRGRRGAATQRSWGQPRQRLWSERRRCFEREQLGAWGVFSRLSRMAGPVSRRSGQEACWSGPASCGRERLGRVPPFLECSTIHFGRRGYVEPAG